MLRSILPISILFVLLSITSELMYDVIVFSKNESAVILDIEIEESESEESEKSESEKKENETKLFFDLHTSLNLIQEEVFFLNSTFFKSKNSNLSGYYLLPEIPPELA